MSVLAPTVAPMRGQVHPWRRLRELAHITLLWHDGGPMGETDFDAQTISLRRGLTWEERRCTVQHELIHVERGPTLEGVLAAREEGRVQRETARRMLPDIYFIGDALAWASDDAHQAAHELGVDADTLMTRLRHLHPAERGYLRERLAHDAGHA